MRFKQITVCLIAVLTTPAFADEQPRTISVSGQGKVSSPPDMARIQTGVQTQAVTAKDALSSNNKAMQRILEVLKKHHVASKDVQTTSFNVSPVYKRDNRNRTQPEIVGYRVGNQVRVKVRNLPDLGKVLDALVQAGSNRVTGISFGVDDPTGLLNQARSRAMSDAKSRASIYAQAGGVTVGKIRTISEQASQIPRPMMRGMMFAAGREAAVPIATGELDFSVTVHVVYDLKED